MNFPNSTRTLLVILAAVAIGSSAYYWTYSARQPGVDSLKSEKSTLEVENAKLKKDASPSPTTSATATTDPTADWKTAVITPVALSFKYPSNLGEVSVKEENGDTGKALSVRFSSNSKYLAGSITSDYTLGRGGMMYESVGTINYSAGKCTLTVPERETSTFDCEKVTSSSGISSYLKVSKTTEAEDMFGSYAVGYIPVTNGTKYQLFGVSLSPESTLISDSESSQLKQILTTFKATN